MLGRCLWAASRFASFLPAPLLNRYLQATVEALQPHQDIILRIMAVRYPLFSYQPVSFHLHIHIFSRAVWGFCDHLKASQNGAILTPMLPVITDALLNLAVLFSNEVLGLVLETLAMVLAVSFCGMGKPP